MPGMHPETACLESWPLPPDALIGLPALRPTLLSQVYFWPLILTGERSWTLSGVSRQGVLRGPAQPSAVMEGAGDSGLTRQGGGGGLGGEEAATWSP